MSPDYLNFFKDNIQIKILEPHGKSTEKHSMECLLCSSTFSGIPKDRKGKFTKKGTVGCPTCARKSGSKKRKDLLNKVSVPSKLKEMGYIIDGDYINNKTHVKVYRSNCCGRTWKAIPNKLLEQHLRCVPCEKEKAHEKEQEKLIKSREYKFKQYILDLENNAKLKILPPYKTTNDYHDILCLICGGEFEATPKSKMNNFRQHQMPGCPKCTNSRRYTSVRETNILKLKEKFIFKEPASLTNNDMLTVTNKVCGHTFTSKVGNLLNRDIECSECGIVNRITRLQAYNEKINSIKRNSIKGLEGYSSRVRLYTERTYKKYEDILNPNSVERKRSGSSDAYHLDHIVSIKECFLHDVPEELCAHKDNLRMVEWSENAEKWARPQSNIPAILQEYFPHYFIREDFRNEFSSCNKGVEIVSPFIFDLYNPDTKTAVIFHASESIVESNVGKKYCFNLRKKCEEHGIRVIQVFEDEWILKRNIVCKKIKHILKESGSTKIFARNTKIKVVDNSTKNSFLDDYHIQGADKSQLNLGAYYNDQLVAVMTFCKPRILMNKKYFNKEGYWELSRFATHEDFHVIGIASKLLKYFVRNYDWCYIYSFADLRWSSSNSNVYEQSGFTLDNKKTMPEYYYLINGKRMHRWGFRKDALREKFPDSFDSTKTEYQNMLENGYDRIWDCGHLKYVMNKE